MKNFLIIWKPNSGFRHNNSLIRGRTYAEAMQTHFHEDAINAVQLYEIVTPYFLNLKTKSFEYKIPVTLYYTQHGVGKIYIKWVDGMVTEEISNALRNTDKKGFKYIKELAKDLENQLQT